MLALSVIPAAWGRGPPFYTLILSCVRSFVGLTNRHCKRLGHIRTHFNNSFAMSTVARIPTPIHNCRSFLLIWIWSRLTHLLSGMFQNPFWHNSCNTHFNTPGSHFCSNYVHLIKNDIWSISNPLQLILSISLIPHYPHTFWRAHKKGVMLPLSCQLHTSCMT